MRLFSTEQVSKYHPDKYADQISDAILDFVLELDENAKVAIETMVKNEKVFISGEMTPRIDNDVIRKIVKGVASDLRYKVGDITIEVNEQSIEINKAVDVANEINAGDQGMMFGYATTETDSMLPFGFDLANKIIKVIEKDVEDNLFTPLKGDAKCQVTVDLDRPAKESLHTLLISVCHEDNFILDTVKGYIKRLIVNKVLIPEKIVLSEIENILINPAGRWTVGGPSSDAGLTGRKIVCDQYGGYIAVGGGAFSGKDASKVDRSGAYMARHVAVETLNKFKDEGLEFIEIQLAYAIGVAKPLSIYVKTNDISTKTHDEINLFVNTYNYTPTAILNTLKLKKPQFYKRASGCHFYGK